MHFSFLVFCRILNWRRVSNRKWMKSRLYNYNNNPSVQTLHFEWQYTFYSTSISWAHERTSWFCWIKKIISMLSSMMCQNLKTGLQQDDDMTDFGAQDFSSFSCLWSCIDFVVLDVTCSVLCNSMLKGREGLLLCYNQPPFTSYVQQLLNQMFKNLDKSCAVFQDNSIVLLKLVLKVRTQYSCNIAF